MRIFKHLIIINIACLYLTVRCETVMNESSKNNEEQYSNQLSMSKSVTRCRDDFMCSDETGAEGNETNTNDDLVQYVALHQNNGHDVSDDRWTNSSRFESPINQEYCASSNSFVVPHSSQNRSTYRHAVRGNLEFLETSQKQVLDPWLKENGLIETNHRMVLPANGCSSTRGGIFFPLPHPRGVHDGSNCVQPMSMQSPVSTGSSAHNETLRQNIIGEQIDGGYMEEADAYMESSDMAVNLVSERGAGVHLPLEMDVGAAGGGGSIDDIGDFIDADIPLHPNGSSQLSSRSNDSVTSSLEELTAGAVMSEKAETEKVDLVGDSTSIHVSVGIAEEVRRRLLGSGVNNLNQTDRAQGGHRNNSPSDLGSVLHHSQASGLSSLSFDKEAVNNPGKCWRWSDGDGVNGLLPSLTSATSLASDLSYGTPSAPLTSPLSTEDEAIMSVMSSPECLNQLPSKVDKCFRGGECLVNSENLNHNKNGRSDPKNGRSDPWSTESISELYCNCKSCIDLLENMNQTTSKHVLEKFFAWEVTANSDKSSAFLRTKHLQNNSTACGHGSEHPLVLGHSRDSCQHFDSDHQRMLASFHGTEICNAEFAGPSNKGPFDTCWPEKSLKSTPLDESFPVHQNRRFSYQNMIDSDPSDLRSSSTADGCSWNSQNGRIASALSENSLHSAQTSRSRPFSLLLDSQRTRNCLDGGCQSIRNGDSSHNEVKDHFAGCKSSHRKKTSAWTQSMSLSEEEQADKVSEESLSNRAHRRNKNGHHCRYGNEMDFMCGLNLSRPENIALKSDLLVACCACPVSSLLRLLGVNDVGRHVCDLFPANGLTEKASLPDYLVSCSTAGVSAEQLISRVAMVTKDLIYGKFFHLYPQRNVDLIPWLKYWIRKGVIALATLKYEHLDGSGDSWQHQLLHSAYEPGLAGASLSEDVVSTRRFSADSSLRISRHSVVSRWHDGCDLKVLVTHTDTRWHKMNVLGQVVNVLREERLQTAVGGYRPQLTPHVVIPAHFKSGVTLYARTDSVAYAELESTVSDFPAIETLNGRANESVKQIPASAQDRDKTETNSSMTRETIF